MPRKFTLTVLLAALVAFGGTVTYGQQVTTGTIEGSVMAEDGSALANAVVTATGSQGTFTAVADDRGRYSVPLLKSGIYNVRVEASGYGTIVLEDVQVNIGTRTQVNAKLRRGQVETVMVTAEQAAIDVKTTSIGENFIVDEFVDYVPIGRNWTNLFALTPGVVSGLGTGDGNYSIGGSSGLENSYLIDGINITNTGYGGVGSYSVVFGSLGSGVTTDFLQEVQVKTGGFEAEYGQALGGIVNSIVKSGTNEFTGNVAAYLTPASMEGSRKRVRLTNGATNTVETEQTDLALSAGGPAVEDRLFWFLAYNPVESEDTFDIETIFTDFTVGNATQQEWPSFLAFDASGADVVRERDNDNYAAKLTWQANAEHRIELSAFGDPSEGDGRTGIAYSDANLFDFSGGGSSFSRTAAGFFQGGGASDIEYGGNNYSLKYEGLITPNFFVEAQISLHDAKFREDPFVNDYSYRERRTTPFLRAGGPGFIGESDDENTQYSIKLTNIIGNHELRYGLQFDDIEFTQTAIYSGDPFLIDFGITDGSGNPVPVSTSSGATIDIRSSIFGNDADYRVTRARINPDQPPTETEELNLFIQDTWQVHPRVTLKLGLRYTDLDMAGSGGFTLPVDLANGTATPVTLMPNSFDFDPMLLPRIGLSADVLGNGRSKLYANYARYAERIPNDLAVRAFSNEVSTLAGRYSSPQPGLDSQLSAGITFGDVPSEILQDSEVPYVDELILGYEQQITDNLSFSVRGVYRDQGRVLEDVQLASAEEIFNYYYSFELGTGAACLPGDGNANCQIPFPDFGWAPFGAYVLANPGENTGQLGGAIPFPKPEREYKALEVSFNKRWADNWMMRANYRYSRLRGNYEGLFRNDNGQSDPNITSLFDFPNSPLMRGQYNAGALNTDRPHVAHLYGAYQFDFGLRVGAGLNWQSGVPRTALLSHPVYINAGEVPGIDPIYLTTDFVNQAWTTTTDASQAVLPADYTDSPRGSLGRTPDNSTIDISLGYQFDFAWSKLDLALDVFNLFNNQEATLLDDAVESTFITANPDFNRIIQYEAPRDIRLTARWTW